VPRFGWFTVVAVAGLALAGYLLYRDWDVQHLWLAIFGLSFLSGDQRAHAIQRRRFLQDEREHGRAAALKLEAMRADTVGRWRAWVYAELERLEGAEALAQVLRDRAAVEAQLPVLLRPVYGIRVLVIMACTFAVAFSLVVLLAG